ncbi:phosphoglucomutase/phosphomannomutase family protein [Peptococcaceae bacterium]|nr:phosphoglucomutase/phosphomannomutase family protein [Peptococcaceae bacterium]
MSIKIAFGTDGWRGIIAEDFIFDNVRLVTRAVAKHLIEKNCADQGVIVGYDNRFLSDRFAEEVVKELNKSGILAYLIESPTPTPVTAYAITIKNAAGAIMLTASHNPPEYNGFKFIPEYAGPALPSVTKKIEQYIKEQQEICVLGEIEKPEGRYGKLADIQHDDEKKGECKKIDPFKRYVGHILKLADTQAIRDSQLKIVVDPMHGAGIGYLDYILKQCGLEVKTINNRRDPLFGGKMPEPKGDLLDELKQEVLKNEADLGLALDGDADRFGIIDKDGRYITPNQFLPILYYHLLEARRLEGFAARTVATTHLLDKIAKKYNQHVEETPVGFKYIGQCLYQKRALIGGEESGGLSIRGHIPEKDGILAGLLAVEIMAYHKKSLLELYEDITKVFEKFYSSRLDIRTTAEDKKRVLEMLNHIDLKEIAGIDVTQKITIDGVKFVLKDGSWVLIRASGTEPLLRIYAESHDINLVKELQHCLRQRLEICIE